MSDKKQTAVQWLLEQWPILESQLPKAIINQALEMEREQIEYFFNCGRQYQLTGEGTFKQVHNETYGGQDESDH
jgi:hypothetical protein